MGEGEVCAGCGDLRRNCGHVKIIIAIGANDQGFELGLRAINVLWIG
jgi:hypothetical protein